MDKKDAIVFVGKNYGVMPIAEIMATTGLSRTAVSLYAGKLRKLGVNVPKYPVNPAVNAFAEAAKQLLAQ